MSIIEIENVCKSFGKNTALKDVSFSINKGEIFGLLGVNGAGKSTLINILAGLIFADSGKISVAGLDVKNDYRETRKLLGVVPQELVYDPFFTVGEMLRLQSGYFGLSYNQDWIDEIVTELKLDDKVNSNIQNLSGGMKRRLLIAQSLVHKPKVLVLDEPTAGVDVGLRKNLWQFVKRLNQQGMTVILTTHYLEEAENLCQRIAMLDKGRLATLSTQAELLQKVPWQDISFKVKQPLPEELSKWQADIEQNTVHIKISSEDNQAIARLMDDLVRHRVEFTELQVKKPSLEKCFLSIVDNQNLSN